MKYVPNLIPEAYRVSLEEFQQNDKKNNGFQKGAIFVIGLLCFAVLLIFFFKSKQQTIEQEIVPAPSVDSLNQLSRRDSLNFHQKAAELAIQKSKWKTASSQYCKALEFASSLDSQYLLKQITVCKNRIRSLQKKPRPVIDSTKVDSTKSGSSSQNVPVDSIHDSSNSVSSNAYQVQSPSSKSVSYESSKDSSPQSSSADLSTPSYYTPHTSSTSNVSGYGSTYVNGYYRKDGTYVSGHTRRSRK